jgi:LmbE family N-acetylglucosaminyl deacetylase
MDGAMKQKSNSKNQPPRSPDDALSRPRLNKFNELLKTRPELFKQFESILGLATAADGDAPWRTADEVEALLVEEIRKLGSQTMQHWAQAAQARALEARLKKKDPELVVRIPRGAHPGNHPAHRHPALAVALGWLLARKLLLRPPHRKRSERGPASGSEGV